MRILAVDDEIPALEFLKETLADVEPSAKISAFRDPQEALNFAKGNPCDVIFLDIKMRGMDGITLAKKIKIITPKCNVIFCTGYSDFAVDAFNLNASGYILKPITREAICQQLENLRYPPVSVAINRIRFQCFGNFEVFVDGKPMRFQYDKTKELLAYLVDRSGALCTMDEIMAVLWTDDRHISYLKMMRKDLLDQLKAVNCEEIILRQWGKLGIDIEKVDCDYYDWKNNKASGINAYNGEYMEQYSWAEFTNGSMLANRVS